MKYLLTVWTTVSLFVYSTLSCNSATFVEDFSSTPEGRGWQSYGERALFEWDSDNGELDVIWDSSRTNSYFHLPLRHILTRNDDFSASFDIRLDNYATGTTPGKPHSFPVAVGFMNASNAFNPSFSRGAGVQASFGPRNLVEFDYFPAFSTFLPTIAQAIVSTNNAWVFNHDNLIDFPTGQWARVLMSFDAGSASLTTTVEIQGQQYGDTQFLTLPPNFDFRVTAFSLSSYSDQRADGSISARGSVDNIAVTIPPLPVTEIVTGTDDHGWFLQCEGRPHWTYVLQNTVDFANWTSLESVVSDGGAVTFYPSLGVERGFFRVAAERP